MLYPERLHRGTAFIVSPFTRVPVPDCGFRVPDSIMIPIMFFIFVPFLKRDPYIIIYLAERREEAY